MASTIQFTATNGKKISILVEQIQRARVTLSSEDDHGARSRVDWSQMNLVKESIEEVSAAIKASLPSFMYLSAGDGKAIWFDAKKAIGPFELLPSQRSDKVQCSIKIMGYRQTVAQAPDEVRRLMRENGGTPFP